MDSYANDYGERYKAIGSNIRRVRNESGISQTELANRIGSNKSAISRYENATQKPSLETLMRVADALAVDLVELLRRKELLLPRGEDDKAGSERIRMLNINLDHLSLETQQNFVRSVRAMYRGYLEESPSKLLESATINLECCLKQ